MAALRERRVPFRVGGAFALKEHAGVSRFTKDFDVFIRPSDAERADVLLLAGDLTDYGLPEEAHVLVRELSAAKMPTVAVLGDHDFEPGKQDEAVRAGGRRLVAEPVDRHHVQAVFHGHAHHGSPEGRRRRGSPCTTCRCRSCAVTARRAGRRRLAPPG